MQERNMRRLCLAMAMFILLFGVCFECMRADSSVHDVFLHSSQRTEISRAVQKQTAGKEIASENISLKNIEPGFHNGIQQQPDDSEDEAAEQKVWAKYLNDAILASNKSFYSQSRQISLSSRDQRKCATSCLHESDGKKRKLAEAA